MKVSFVVLCYNEEKNILICLQSILNQKSKYIHEVIIINDASTDNSAVKIDEFCKRNKKFIHVKFIKNQGRGFARNVGVIKSTGDMIAFVDGDIILPNNWLATCLKYIENNSVVCLDNFGFKLNCL